MAEAVADEDTIVVGVLLIHPFAQIALYKDLLAVSGEIDDRTLLSAAEAIFHQANSCQANRQHGFERLGIHDFSACATAWTSQPCWLVGALAIPGAA